MRKLRILHVVYRMNRGGVETWLMHLLKRIDRSRFQIDFVSHADTPGEYDGEIRSLGSRIYSCCHPANFARHRREFRRILSNHGPFDVVHSHDPMWDGVAMNIARRAGVPVRIVHSHNDIRQYLPGNPLKRAYMHYAIRQGRSNATNGFACSGVAAASYFGEKWAKDPRWRIFYCGEDFSPFSEPVDRDEIRKQLGLPADAIVIGHVGSFRSDQKNHALILRIARELTLNEPSIRFLLIGEGALRPEMQRQAVESGLGESVIFAGSRNDVPGIMLGAMDLFLFPSKYEGLGLVAVEAQAAGLPCVFSRAVPAEAVVVPELVQYVSLDRPPEEWARVIREHFRSTRSCSRPEALARVEASLFNIGRGLANLEKIYSGQ